GLEYVGNDGERHQPVMIHRALFGSVERFFAVLLEHYAAAFPTRLSPLQVRILPAAHAHELHAPSPATRFEAEGYRVVLTPAHETLGNRIRRAKGEKVPYVLVVGDDDVAADTVGVNPRGGDVERGVPVASFLDRLALDVGHH